ncbi:orotidine-5'-phosphate decarboxylase [Edaphobacter sp. 12200R-103]|uniref:orotidine-5'-phosphate decarboxylase n=1 Tax=Edaphobacter sp. 12200R-103 TaxID=2703788 RepID=UPI00138D8AF1|nr:orotidine-5'-phosphate decarboxylase [Edaphobacter sp. 12200R-103]QHS51055.1 orotidine-5'-phosphate decarboxylase [Edaphobacter sp. 12200R-103]
MKNLSLNQSPEDYLAVALDVPDAPAALDLVDRMDGACRWLKVGMELYYAAGNGLVEQLRDRGYSIFLDLKLHDIPNTVAGAVRSATRAGASLLTVHGCGGGAMLRAASEAAQAPGSPRLIAVTVLTSMDAGELAAVGVTETPAAQALRLARLAKASGIDGMVCSAEEVCSLRQEIGDDALLVVPGIRPSGTSLDDQRRVSTPSDAIRRGASLLVVGRPITKAPDPAAATRAILAEIQSEL